MGGPRWLRVSIVFHTLSKRRRTSRKRRNFGNKSLSPSAPLAVISTFTLSKLITLFILCLLILLYIACPIGCSSSQPIYLCTYFVIVIVLLSYILLSHSFLSCLV